MLRSCFGRLIWVLGLLAFLATTGRGWAADPPDSTLENRRCVHCHGQADLGEMNGQTRRTMINADDASLVKDPPRPGLFVDPQVIKFSVHGQVQCISCHPDANDLPHRAPLGPATCRPCHEQQFAEHKTSVHGQAIIHGSRDAAHCSDCHGTHDILSHRNVQSRTYKLRLPYTCARCHSNQKMMKDASVRQPHAAEQYLDSMHGRGLLTMGLIVAPSCNDCHGVHDIRPNTDPKSSIFKDNVPKTCGKCHIWIEATYRKSIHGQLLAAGDERGPVCITCHTAHEIVQPNQTAFKLKTDERCGTCHQERLKHYRETFHGKAMALGRPNVAACYDCHGHHDILPVSNSASHLSPQNKLQTCQKCHPSATAKFTGYIAHADHTDRKGYPALYWTFMFMTTIVLGTFAFFSVHTIMWLVRSSVLYLRDPKAFREIKIKAIKDDEQFVRFRPFERFLHGLVMVSFLLLVATGMPLKFYDTAWARWIVHFVGGLEVTAALHRLGAIITFCYFGLHLLSLLRALIRNRGQFRDPQTGRWSLRQSLRILFGPEMPLPNLDDLRDMWAHQKWFFGRGPQPQFDKWTYWEKFDYFGVFWGVAIIGISGLIMWFPEKFTQVLPGWLINVALIVHSDEALLAAGFIFTFHFFNVHFRIEKFPMDPVIFSGRISRSEMMHERRRWYERLRTEGRLDSVRVKDEWSQWKRVMHPLGFLAFGAGVVLLGLIFYAMSVRLFGFGG